MHRPMLQQSRYATRASGPIHVFRPRSSRPMPLSSLARICPPAVPLRAARRFTARTALLATLIPAAAFTGVTATSPSVQAQSAEAEELFQKGNAFYKAKKWAEAYDAYEKAYAIEPNFKIAGNLGDVSLTLGKHREAAEYLSHALREMPDDKAALKKKVEARLQQAKKEVGTLSITVSVEGANVSCNDRDVGVAPLSGEVFVEAGATSVVVKAEGHKEARRTVALAKGEAKSLEIVLEVDTSGGAVVPPGGTGGANGIAGSGSAGGDGAGGSGAEGGATVDTGGMSTRDVVLIGGIALTAVGVGVGVGYALVRSSAKDDAASLRKQAATEVPVKACRPGIAVCDDLMDANDRGENAAVLSTVGFIGGAVAGAATIATWLLWPEKSSTGATHSTLSAQPLSGGAQIQLTGSF